MKFKEYLDEPIELQDIIDNLDFDEDDLHRAAMTQPKYFLEAARYRVRAMRTEIRTEAALKVLEADIAQEIRIAADRHDEKVTEGSVKEQVQGHKKIVEAKTAHQEARVAEKFADLLVEAYRARKDAIKILAELRGQEGHAELRIQENEMATKGFRKSVKEVRKQRGER